MIDIDLIYDRPICACVSDKPTSVNRVGDIVLIPSDVPNSYSLEGRPPWGVFVIAGRWAAMAGKGLSTPSNIEDSQIRLTSSAWDIATVNKVYGQEIGLALIQQNDTGYQAAICNAILAGFYISQEIQLFFTVPKCEMIYNR